MHPSWQRAMPQARALLDEIEKGLDVRRALGDVLAPPLPLVMRAFEAPIDSIRVIIVGQDPYPTEGDACGFAFAVAAGRPLPRSLRNIMQELAADLPAATAGGELARWAQQGVMLLNRQLTTAVGKPLAHKQLGWQAFTDLAIETLNSRAKTNNNPLVAILWGAHAQQLKPLLTNAAIIESVHPSPLSARRGFFGSKPFSRANQALQIRGSKPLDWSC